MTDGPFISVIENEIERLEQLLVILKFTRDEYGNYVKHNHELNADGFVARIDKALGEQIAGDSTAVGGNWNDVRSAARNGLLVDSPCSAAIDPENQVQMAPNDSKDLESDKPASTRKPKMSREAIKAELLELLADGPLRQVQLVERSNASSASVGRVLKELEERDELMLFGRESGSNVYSLPGQSTISPVEPEPEPTPTLAPEQVVEPEEATSDHFEELKTLLLEYLADEDWSAEALSNELREKPRDVDSALRALERDQRVCVDKAGVWSFDCAPQVLELLESGVTGTAPEIADATELDGMAVVDALSRLLAAGKIAQKSGKWARA